MSSIYRKGRDGYYYYQTYLYNSFSKKKDKKIFHSLGTKDQAKAEIEKKRLDLKYKQLNRSYLKLFNVKYILIFLSFMTLGGGCVYFFLNTAIDISEEIPMPISATQNIPPKLLEKTNSESDYLMKQPSERKITTLEIKKNKKEPKPIESLNSTFNIQRVDVTSGAYKLGKIHATINLSSTKKEQILACKTIAKKYTDLKNIIICLYADNKIGQELAKGNDLNVSVEGKKQFWLGMYTYNEVEGEFFDDNPSQYLVGY